MPPATCAILWPSVLQAYMDALNANANKRDAKGKPLKAMPLAPSRTGGAPAASNVRSTTAASGANAPSGAGAGSGAVAAADGVAHALDDTAAAPSRQASVAGSTQHHPVRALAGLKCKHIHLHIDSFVHTGQHSLRSMLCECSV